MITGARPRVRWAALGLLPILALLAGALLFWFGPLVVEDSEPASARSLAISAVQQPTSGHVPVTTFRIDVVPTEAHGSVRVTVEGMFVGQAAVLGGTAWVPAYLPAGRHEVSAEYVSIDGQALGVVAKPIAVVVDRVPAMTVMDLEGHVIPVGGSILRREPTYVDVTGFAARADVDLVLTGVGPEMRVGRISTSAQGAGTGKVVIPRFTRSGFYLLVSRTLVARVSQLVFICNPDTRPDPGGGGGGGERPPAPLPDHGQRGTPLPHTGRGADDGHGKTPGGQLPRTGSDTALLAGAGIVLLLAGGGLQVAGRSGGRARRRRAGDRTRPDDSARSDG